MARQIAVEGEVLMRQAAGSPLWGLWQENGMRAQQLPLDPPPLKLQCGRRMPLSTDRCKAGVGGPFPTPAPPALSCAPCSMDPWGVRCVPLMDEWATQY